MEIHFLRLNESGQTSGTVVVIDVMRAFTTAAWALASGALEIYLVSTVEEAFVLRNQLQAIGPVRLMGEVNGLPVPGFDFDNSPTQLAAADLSGMRVIHRTSAGTQGVIRNRGAEHLLAASFVVAGATLRQLRLIKPPSVTFVITGDVPGLIQAPEDWACAEYLADCLRSPLQNQPDPEPYLKRVRDWKPTTLRGGAPPAAVLFEDLMCAQELDRFDFFLPVERRSDYLVIARSPNSLLKPVTP